MSRLKNRALILSAAIASLAQVQLAMASDATWASAPGTSFWNDAANWQSAGAAYLPVANDALFFGGSTIATLENDLAEGTAFTGLTFNSDASAYTLAGNGITLAGDITQNSTANPQVINFNLVLNGNRIVQTLDTGTADLAQLSIGGVISDGGAGFGFTKTGGGTLLLTGLGGAHTYTGTTNVLAGALKLDYTSSTVASNMISASSALNLGGFGSGTLQGSALIVTGADGATNSQAFAGTTINTGTNLIAANDGAGGTVNLDLGAFTRNGASTAIFTLPSAGAIHATGLSNNTSGIIGTWATIGTSLGGADWATVDGSGNIGVYTGYTAVTGTGPIADDPLSNVKISTSTGIVTLDASTTNINTLLYADSGNGTLDVGASGTLRLGVDGAIGHTDTTAGNSFTLLNGTVTAGGNTDGTPGTIHVISNGNTQSGGGVAITSVITDNGAGGTVSLVKSGPSPMTLNSANTFSGGVTVISGRVQTNNGSALGTGPITIYPGGQLFANSGSFANPMFIAGIGTTKEQFGAIRLGSVTASGTLTLIGDARVSRRAGTGTFSGVITGPYNLEFGGPSTSSSSNSTVFISNPGNDWSGGVKISDGTLGLGNDEVIPDGALAGIVDITGLGTNALSVLDLNGHTETINGLISTVDPTRAQVRSRNANASTLLIGANDVSSTYAGTFLDGTGKVNITKIGNGTLTLSGAVTHTGLTSVNAGTLALVGASNNVTNSDIVVGAGGTLNVTGISGGFGLNNSQNLTNNGHVFGSVAVNNNQFVRGTGTFDHGINVAGGTVAPGTSIGTLTTGTLAVNSGTLLMEIDGATADRLNVTGAATFAASGAGIAMSLLSAPTASSYDVLTTGSISGTPSLLTPTLGRTHFSIDSTALASNIVRIDVTGGPASIRWDNTGGSGNGTDWEETSQNWNNVGAPDLFFTLDNVTFDDTNNGHYNVNVATTVIPGSITVNNNAGTYVFSGSTIAGAGLLTKSGTGAITLNNANTYSGGTTLNAGTLNIGNDSAIGTGTLTINGGSIDAVGGDRILASNPQAWAANVQFLGSSALAINSGTITLNANPTINVQANTLTLGGSIQDGTGNSITKSGSGTLVLRGASTYTGTTDINSGTVLVSNSNSLGAIPSSFDAAGTVTIASGAVLDVGGSTANNNIDFGQKLIKIAGPGINDVGVLTNTVSSGNGSSQQNAFERIFLTDDASVGGPGRFDIRADQVGGLNTAVLDLNGKTLTKINSGSFIIVRTDVTDGNLVINGGQVQLESTTSVANLSTGKSITINGGKLLVNGLTGDVSRPIIFNSGELDTNANNTSTIGSNITLNDNLNVNVFNTNGTGVLVLNGSISNGSNGAKQVSKQINGTGTTSTLALAGSNSFTGGLNISGGIVRIDNPNALNPVSPNVVNLSGGTTLRINGNSIAVGGLQGGGGTPAGIVENNNATDATLTINTGGNNYSLDGNIVDGAAGTLSLAKSGTGTQRLQGSNTYTGVTTINDGTLVIGNGGNQGSISPLTSITGSATGNLGFDRSDDVTFSNAIGGAVSVTKNGSNTLTLTATHTYSGTTTVANGALVAAGVLPNTGTVLVQGGTLSGSGDGVTGGRVGRVTLSSGGVRPGASPADNSVGSLTMDSFRLDGGDLRFDIGGAVGDSINVLNTATFNGGGISLNLTQDVPAANSYVVLTANAFSGAQPTLTTSSLGRIHFAIDSAQFANHVLQVDVTGAPNHLVWIGNAPQGPVLENQQQAKNWQNLDQPGLTPDFYYQADFIEFPEGSTQRTVNVSNLVAPGAVTFSNSTGSYSLSGNGFTGHTGITINGGGTVNFNLNNSYTGVTAVQNGTLVLSSSSSLPNGANVVLGDSTSSGVLDINGNDINVATLATSGTGAGNIVTNNATGSDKQVNISGGGSGAFASVIQDGTSKIRLSVSNGSLVLTGNNTYSNGTDIGGTGFLQIGDGTNAGSISLSNVNNNGILAFHRGDSTTTVLTDSINGGGSIQLLSGTLQVGAGTTSGQLSGGSILTNGALVFNRSDDITLSGAISGSGSLRQSGTGTLTLSGSSTYSGGLTVDSGSVRVTAAGAAGVGGTITINNGTFVSSVTLGADPIVFNGGTLGVTNAPTVFSSGDLYVPTGTTSRIIAGDPGTSGNDSNGTFTGAMHGSGTILLLANEGSSSTPDGGPGLRFSGVGSDFSGTIVVGAKAKVEISNSTASNSPWGTGKVIMTAGTFDGSGSTGGSYSEINLRNNNNGDTIFGNDFEISGTGRVVMNPLNAGAASPQTVTLGNLKIGDQQIVTANKNGGGVNSVEFTSATLTGGNAGFEPTSGTARASFSGTTNLIVGAINETAPSSLTMSGVATLTMTGNNTYTGGTNVQSGTLITNTNLSNGALNITGGYARVAAKPVAGDPAGATVLPALTITGAGSTLDLTNNAMIVHNGNLTDIRGQIISGYNGTGDWQGAGITSSTAAASSGQAGIGYGTAASLGLTQFAGQPVVGTDVLARYTLYGDANLDGKVNLLDFNALATNFAGAATAWTNADFNYDGTVNSLDFDVLAQNFNQFLPASPASPLGTLVPEPGTIGLLGIAAGLGLMRRRRRCIKRR